MTPDFVLARLIRPEEHPVDYFWELMDQLSDADYPAGVRRVDERHPGTWAFSSGAGLVWWPGTPRPNFPVRGVMFVGDNLRAYDKWKLDHGRWGDPSDHSMKYWRRALPLLDQAGIPGSEAFFTNAYVGLIAGNNSSAPFRGRTDRSYCRWCAALLIMQIQVMQPRLIAALGRQSQRALDRWKVAGLGGVDGRIVKLYHPSNREGRAVVDADVATLRKAYVLENSAVQSRRP